MKEYICDLCKKRIEPKDIRTELTLKIGKQEETIDMHSLCYYMFLRELKKETEK